MRYVGGGNRLLALLCFVAAGTTLLTPNAVGAHDAEHAGLIKGGFNGDVISWTKAVAWATQNGGVFDLATGQVIKFSGFSVAGDFYSIDPDGRLDRQGYSNQTITPGVETVAWIGRDCEDFDREYMLVLKPFDETVPEQSIVVRKHPLNSDLTLPEPWPRGTTCFEE